jgi:hypothetical protein
MSRSIITVSREGGQIPLLIVQTNVFVPLDNPVTPELGEPVEVIVALPAMTDHNPVPAVGVFPVRVAVSEQTV